MVKKEAKLKYETAALRVGGEWQSLVVMSIFSSIYGEHERRAYRWAAARERVLENWGQILCALALLASLFIGAFIKS